MQHRRPKTSATNYTYATNSKITKLPTPYLADQVLTAHHNRRPAAMLRGKEQASEASL